MRISKINFFLLLVGFNFVSVFSQNADTKLIECVNFLNTQNTSAKDYVLGLFEKYDIVVLCERYHQEMTQYDLIFDIVSDKKFTTGCGQIMMEVGVSNSGEKLNRFLHNDTLPEAKVEDNLLNIIRNNDFNPLWEMTNYPTFIKRLHYFNKTLPKEQKITVHPVDVPFWWDNIKSRKEYKATMDTVDSGLRDEIMGKQMQKIITENKNKKFLIIMNSYHSWFLPKEYGAAWWVKDRFADRTVNVLINNVFNKNLTGEGQWDAAFKITSNENLGFDFEDTPFGQTDFRKYVGELSDPEFDSIFFKTYNKMQDFFHGYVFYLPVEKHILSYGYPNYIEGKFKKEFGRRSAIAYGKLISFFGKYKIRKHFNTVRQKRYDNLESLINTRDQWLQK
ncbi:MAG: hypothetical protein LBS01_01515 [Prevotellaceae bacterium]|jgi:hypothetical protein|nr:hypothetical protein [Prevotellaceae bacterium]